MTKRKFVLSLCCLLLSLMLFRIQAHEAKKSALPKCELRLVRVADTNPSEFIWQVDALRYSAFKSLSSYSLRKWVADLPANSTIEWFPSDARMAGDNEPSAEALKQFQAFCKVEAVKFVIHYSG